MALLRGILALALLLTSAVAAVAYIGYAQAPLPVLDSDWDASRGGGMLLRRDKQQVLLVHGSPYAMGHHNTILLAEQMARQEHDLIDLLNQFAPAPAQALLVWHLSLFYLNGLENYLTADERQEMFGLASASPDPLPELGPRYSRVVAYHAIHELSHRFAFDSPYLSMGCSLLAFGGERTVGGTALLGRNFDFEGGPVFDSSKVVVVARPDSGFGFVSVSWAGMAGVLSGMNEHGLALVLNAGASADYNRVGVPTTILLRRALQGARSIDEAVALLTASPRFVTDIIGMADASGEVAVLELTPNSHALRRSRQRLTAANQLEDIRYIDDPVNTERQAQTTTVPRHRRLARLLVRQSNAPLLLARDLLPALRDRRAADGRHLPLGHRHAIDALITTHSVVFDTRSRRFWVSQGPHTLGPYHGYDLPGLLTARDEATARSAYLPSWPADPLLGVAAVVRQTRATWPVVGELIAAGELDQAEARLRGMSVLGDHPRTLQLRGELALARGQLEWGRLYLQAALDTPMEYPLQQEEIRRQLTGLAAAPRPVPTSAPPTP